MGNFWSELAGKCRQLRALLARRSELQEKNKQAHERIDYLNFQLQEIENLNLKQGDETLLQERLKILAAAETILEKSEALGEDLYQDDNSVYNLLAKNMPAVGYLQTLFPEFNHFKEEIERFFNLLPEISAFLNTLAGKVEFNENELNEISEKLSRLEKLKAKHKLTMEQLLGKYEQLRAERDELLNLNFSLADSEKEIARALAEYKALQEKLRKNRRLHADKLSALIVGELALLEMDKGPL